MVGINSPKIKDKQSATEVIIRLSGFAVCGVETDRFLIWHERVTRDRKNIVNFAIVLQYSTSTCFFVTVLVLV
jgi:hypothetical protein